MEEEQRINAGTVDPELQESISSLVAALGGVDFQSHKYTLGDDALECLRDLRKWLQFYDAKYDRLEVSCAIANTTLIVNDIPEILGLWELSLRKKKDAYLDRIALACLELLVPLTWPIDIVGKEQATEKFSQSMFLKQAQIKYKTAILTHSSHGILKAMIRIAAKQNLGISYRDRTPMEDGVLTLICSFFRNLVAINTGEDDDRSVTIREFSKQKVLQFLVTLSASLGSQIDAQDTLILETIYFLVRGVDASKVFGVSNADGDPMQDLFKKDLKTLLEVEEDMNRAKFKPTRHSRFGTMVSMSEGAAGEYLSVSGQRGVASMESTLAKITDTKKWNKPKYRNVKDEHDNISYTPSNVPVNSDPEAMETLRTFASEFLDSSFNPLVVKLRKQIDKQQTKIYHLRGLIHYCYFVGWFLDCDQSRARAMKIPMDYSLVGEALNTPSITTTLELLRKSLEMGELRSTDLTHACMVSLRQILTCVQGMCFSPVEEFRDAADGMKARMFYDDTWLNMLAVLPRTSRGKSIAYASETVALTHIVLKSLEVYSKQYTVMYVKSRHASKHGEEEDYEDIGEEEAQRKSIRVTNERKFSYEKFLMKYVNEHTVCTYERVLQNHKTVSQETILHVFSFLRKTFAKTNAKAIFYRMSLMHLLLEITDSLHGLPRDSKARHVAKEFLRYYVHKFASTVAQMPSLHIQTNMVMTPADAFYYDHAGVDKVKFKPPKHEWKLKKQALTNFTPEKQFAVLVAALVDSGKEGSLQWVQEQITYLIERSDERIHGQSLTTDREKIRLVHNDGVLRLLLRTMGMYVDTSAGQIRIPTTIDELDLLQKVEWLTKYQNESVAFDNGKVASDYITLSGGYESDEEEEHSGDFMSLRSRLYDIGKPNEVHQSETGQQTLNRGDMPAEDEHSNGEENSSRHQRYSHASPYPAATDDDVTNPDGVEEHESPQLSTGKRTHSFAFDDYGFDVNVSDGEEEVPQSIATFSRRRLFVDDDED